MKKVKWVVFIFVFSVIICRAIFISAFEPGRARNQIYGDGYSDINTISATHFFYDKGFSQTALLPVHYYYPVDSTKNIHVYTHYPALPDVLAGLYAYLFKSADERVLRIFPMLLSVFFFFFIYFVLEQILKNRFQAFIGGTIMVMSNYFICWADNLHQHLYGEVLKWMFFYLLFRYYEDQEKKIIRFLPLILIVLLQVNISFEQPVFIGVLTLCFSYLYDRKIFSIETVSIALAIIIGFGIHILQNIFYFGSFDLALHDMKHAFLFRTAGIEGGGMHAEQVFGLGNIWQIPFDWFNRMERYYAFPGWAMLVIAMFVMPKIKQENLKLYEIIWITFIASVSWSFMMPQHAFIHSFTNKHFSVFYALLASVGLPMLWYAFRESIKQKKRIKTTMIVCLFLYMLIMFITQQLFPVYIKYGIGFAIGNS